MARDLNRTVRDIFSIDTYNRHYRTDVEITPDIKYMEIPVDSKIFEVPVFALQAFTDTVKNNRDMLIDAIVVALNTRNILPNYKTVDRFMRDVLTEPIERCRLIKLEVKQGNTDYVFYGTHGAVFDKDFNPLAICSYRIKKVYEPFIVDERGYQILEPVLRISPATYLYKETSMQRFIVNKLINVCLENKVNTPPRYVLGDHFQLLEDVRVPVKIEICDSPFIIRQADKPGISTDNQKLLQIAMNHFEEVVQ